DQGLIELGQVLVDPVVDVYPAAPPLDRHVAVGKVDDATVNLHAASQRPGLHSTDRFLHRFACLAGFQTLGLFIGKLIDREGDQVTVGPLKNHSFIAESDEVGRNAVIAGGVGPHAGG